MNAASPAEPNNHPSDNEITTVNKNKSKKSNT